MPNYNPNLTRALWDGRTAVMADATLVAPFTSQAYAVGPDPTNSQVAVTFTNPSTTAAVVQASTTDVDGNYATFGNVGAGAVAVLQMPNGMFFRLSLANAPNAAITVAR